MHTGEKLAHAFCRNAMHDLCMFHQQKSAHIHAQKNTLYIFVATSHNAVAGHVVCSPVKHDACTFEMGTHTCLILDMASRAKQKLCVITQTWQA
jgi:hypothetical protein